MAIYPSAAVETALHDAAVAHSVPLSLLRAIAFVESSFDPKQVGPLTATGHAEGLMQLKAATQKTYGVTDPFDPKQSADGAARFLAKLAKPLAWKIDAMLAAYYMGAVGYARALAAKQPIPKAAEEFRRKVLAAQRYYQQQVEATGSTAVLRLDSAIRTLSGLNPTWAPATLALQQWRAYFARHANDGDAVLTDRELGGMWANYRAAYARAPLTETVVGAKTIGAPLPELVEPDAWVTNVERIKQAKAMASKALDVTSKVLSAAEAAAESGLIGAVALAIAFLLGRRR